VRLRNGGAITKTKDALTMADQLNPDDLTEVFASIDPMQVRMAHDLLDGSGIETFIFDDDSSRMLGSTGAVPSRLMVHAADADEARSRLKELGFTE
jgi:hypothetical protein